MSGRAPRSILFVTTTLGTGGAERMMLKILQRLDRRLFEPTVVSLLDEGTVGRQIEQMGIPVICLRMDRLHRIVAAPISLARLIRHRRFDLIQGWMYHGNLLAWAGRALAFSKAPLSFGIRQSLYGLGRERFNTRWVIRGNALVSRRVQGCIFNSRFSLRTHRDFGFDADNMLVIPNGFDLETFAPRPLRGAALRAELKLGPGPVVGMVARFHPVKGHRDFLQAASIVHRRMPQAKFVLAGPGVHPANPELSAWIHETGLLDAVILLGERDDIPDLNSVFDVACLSSLAEAFPNAIGESMACGVPCVVTDVGDCAEIVGTTGRVARAGDPASLAAAMLELLGAGRPERESLGRAARLRIMGDFNIAHVGRQYESYFSALCSTAESAGSTAR